MINTQTKLYAVLGFPIKHSFSPQMQNLWFKQKKLNCAYLSFAVKPEEFAKTLDALKMLGFCGLNITIPHKKQALKLVDVADKAAKTIGAINTIHFKNGKLYGYNTDYSGFLADLSSHKVNLKNKNVLLYGAGGAARAIAYALTTGCGKNRSKKIFVADIMHEAAIELSKTFKLTVIDDNKIHGILHNIDLIVNASACGMEKSHVLPFTVEKINAKAVVYDLIYNKVTPFGKLAKAKKLKYFTGEGMLVRQGAHSFKIWTGINPDAKSALKLLKNL